MKIPCKQKPFCFNIGMVGTHSRMLSPDNYVQSPNSSQSFNRYSYCWNNPLKYTDPSGEIIWAFPTVGWSKEGGFSLGIVAGVGIPGGLSAQTGVGYNFKANDAYGFIGTTFALNTISGSYSTRSGFNVGYAFGATPFSGLPISTNLGTIGVNYNISQNGWSGNISAWQFDQNGVMFNPSISVMIAPEHSTNFVRGQGWNTNDEVLSNFVANNNYQGALNYWGFEGKYEPGNKNLKGAPAVTTTYSGETYFDTHAFTNGFDYLYAISDHEYLHRQQFNRIGRKMYFDAQNPETNAFFEYEAYIHNYKNQGLYPKHNIDLEARINYTGSSASLNYNKHIEPFTYSKPYWHNIYKIKRKW